MAENAVWTLMKISVVIDDETGAYVQEHPSHWGSVRITPGGNDKSNHSQFVALPQGEWKIPVLENDM